MTRRLLIVSPGFHGYYAAIARAFESLGYETSTYCYDEARSDVEKAWRKMRHELPSKLRGQSAHLSAATVTQRAVTHLEQVRPDAVLVVRGDVFGEHFWAAAAAGGRPVAVWMYDEMRRTEFDADLAAAHARIATYSLHDTRALQERGIEALHVPLGFDHLQPVNVTRAGDGLVSFIGAEFPRRREAVERLVAEGVPVKAWGRGWSDHLLDRARTWRLSSVGVPNGRDVPGREALGIMRGSAATLNIHGDQDGFTMRTFEAAGVGGVQLVDRPDVSEFYEPGTEVLVYENLEHLVELAQRVTTKPGEFDELRRRAAARTLADHTLVKRAELLQRLW